MPATFVSLLAAKAKLAGAVFVGGALATAAIGGGAVAFQQVADSAPAPVTSESPAAESPAANTDPTPTASTSTATDSVSPEATEFASPEPTESESPEPADVESPKPAVVHVAMHKATVTSIDAASLVVTVGGTTYTWALNDATHFSGFTKNSADIKPGMVLNIQGNLDAGAYTATHVVTPGNNKQMQPKPAKPAKTHGKTTKTHGKGHK